MPKAKRQTPPTTMQWWYTFDTYRNEYRVWRSDWPGDTFEFIAPEPFTTLLRLSVTLSIPIDEYDD